MRSSSSIADQEPNFRTDLTILLDGEPGPPNEKTKGQIEREGLLYTTRRGHVVVHKGARVEELKRGNLI